MEGQGRKESRGEERGRKEGEWHETWPTLPPHMSALPPALVMAMRWSVEDSDLGRTANCTMDWTRVLSAVLRVESVERAVSSMAIWAARARDVPPSPRSYT